MDSASRVTLVLGLLLLLLAAARADAGAEAEAAWRAARAAWGGSEPLLAAALNASAAAAEAPSPPCLQAVREVLAAARRAEAGALRVLDASVKVPTGVLALHTKHFGNWDECVAEGAHMCFVRVGVSVGARAGVPRAMELEGALGARAEEAAGTSLALQLAQCVPAACGPADVQALYGALLGGGAMSVAVNEGDCTGAGGGPAMDAADWTAVGVLSVVVALALASTAYDALTPHGPAKRPLLAAFSVVANGRKLLAAPRRDADASLACLHGIRVLSMCWVVLGHRYMTSAMLPSVNLMFILKFFNDWYRVGVSNATLSVDTFFVLSGLLVGYLFFKQKPADRRLNLPLYYLHRYIRLTPAFATMVLLAASLLIHTGWGPNWMATMSEARASCQRSWWSSLLYVSNYVQPESQCVGQSWYLMVDMQLHWLSPLLLLPLARWPRAGMALMAALAAGGVAVAFALSYENGYPANLLLFRDPVASMHYFRYYYTPAYTRFVPYVVGVWAGRALALRGRGGEARARGDAGAWALAWAGVAALLLVPLVTGFHFLREQPAPGAFTALYNALHRPAWALGVVGVVYLCACGRGGPVNAFLSWTGFQVLGRFSYCVFLVHMSVQDMQTGALKTSVHLSDGAILAAFAGDLASALVLGAVLSLLCESPFVALEKELLRGPRRAPAPLPAPATAPGPAPAPTKDPLPDPDPAPAADGTAASTEPAPSAAASADPFVAVAVTDSTLPESDKS